MNTKKTILSIFVTFLISNVLTTIWYMLTHEMNTISFQKSNPDFMILTLNHILYALGFVYLFPFYFESEKKVFRGFKYGVIISAIMFIPMGLVIRGIWEVELNFAFLLNTIAHLLIGGLMGFVLAFIYNYKNK